MNKFYGFHKDVLLSNRFFSELYTVYESVEWGFQKFTANIEIRGYMYNVITLFSLFWFNSYNHVCGNPGYLTATAVINQGKPSVLKFYPTIH